MGRKVHPVGFRLGFNKDWTARWYAKGDNYADLLHEDFRIRSLIHNNLRNAAVARVTIERFPKQVRVVIHSAKPGVVIGRKGASVNQLRTDLEQLTQKKVRVEVEEVARPELDAVLIAESVVEQLEKRVSHKRVMKQVVQRAMRAGAKGIRVEATGRLGGAEMARREWVREGRVPLQTLRADVDFAIREALVTLGRIGVKVWVYHGEKLPEALHEEPADRTSMGSDADA